jgi:hypothetical protein
MEILRPAIRQRMAVRNGIPQRICRTPRHLAAASLEPSAQRPLCITTIEPVTQDNHLSPKYTVQQVLKTAVSQTLPLYQDWPCWSATASQAVRQ